MPEHIRTRFTKQRGTMAERLEFYSMMVAECGCMIWMGSLDTHGYGHMTIDGKTRLSHIVSYETFVGPVPEGMELDHLCRVRCCINPRHLEAVTHDENIRR